MPGKGRVERARKPQKNAMENGRLESDITPSDPKLGFSSFGRCVPERFTKGFNLQPASKLDNAIFVPDR